MVDPGLQFRTEEHHLDAHKRSRGGHQVSLLHLTGPSIGEVYKGLGTKQALSKPLLKANKGLLHHGGRLGDGRQEAAGYW